MLASDRQDSVRVRLRLAARQRLPPPVHLRPSRRSRPARRARETPEQMLAEIPAVVVASTYSPSRARTSLPRLQPMQGRSRSAPEVFPNLFQMRIEPVQYGVIPQHAVGGFQHPVILVRE